MPEHTDRTDATADPATTVTREVTLDAPIDAVWEAVSDPAALARWLGDAVELDVRPGGVGTVRLPDGDRSVLVTAVEDGRRLSLLWWRDADGETSSVDLALVARPDGTRLTVVERLLTPASAPSASLRWGCALGVLAAAGLAVPVRA